MSVQVFKMELFYRQSRERFRIISENDVDIHEFSMTYSLLINLIDVQLLPKKRRRFVSGRLSYRKRGRQLHHEIIMKYSHE